MIVSFPAKRPAGAVIASEPVTDMKTILHIGAHRCATTTFRSYMRQNASRLRTSGVVLWGPKRTRTGLFGGLQAMQPSRPARNARQRGIGRVKLNCARQAESGTQALIVSDQNMIGGLSENIRSASLYAGAGERMARYTEAFEGYVTDVVVNVRSLEWYWASTLGFGLTQGWPTPTAADLQRLTEARRSWRDVITDVACAMEGVNIHVLPFESYAARPEAQFFEMTGLSGPVAHPRSWLNATPRLPALRKIVPDIGSGDGRWQPFDVAQRATLRARYAEDIARLRAGADGLARLADDRMTKGDGLNRTRTEMTRGNRYDHTERRLARHRGG